MPQLEQQFTDTCSQLPYSHLHCLDGKKLQNINNKRKFFPAFCHRLYQKFFPNKTISTVQNIINLQTKKINLKQQLETSHLFILLRGDATANPEFIDFCNYLTEVLHLG